MNENRKRIDLPPVYPITNTRISDFRKHYQIVEILCSNGASIIQMRDTNYTSKEWYYDAVIAVKTAKKHDTKLIINDRIDVAITIGADGVHLGDSDIRPEIARKVTGSDFIIGYSAHSVEDAERMASTGSIDYLAIGPIFETDTKNTGTDPLGPDVLRKLKPRVKIPIVAIGGVTRQNARNLLGSGADSVAGISAIMDGNIAVNMDNFAKEFDSF